jgi:hypothetical protein
VLASRLLVCLHVASSSRALVVQFTDCCVSECYQVSLGSYHYGSLVIPDFTALLQQVVNRLVLLDLGEMLLLTESTYKIHLHAYCLVQASEHDSRAFDHLTNMNMLQMGR